MHIPRTWRAVALFIGAIAVGLSAYGAFEFQLKLDQGQIGYLTIAAPFVAASAALIPVLIDLCWKAKQYAQAACWSVLLIPAALVVFLSVAERVHYAKAGATAERSAKAAKVALLTTEYEGLQQALRSVEARAAKARSLKQCREDCLKKHAEAVELAQKRLDTSRAGLIKAKEQQVTEATLEAPAWLLPLTLDILAFMSVWTGLAPGKPVKRRSSKQIRKPAAQRKKRTTLKAANTNNVVRL